MNRDYDRNYRSSGRIDDMNFDPFIAAYNLERIREEEARLYSYNVLDLFFDILVALFMLTKRGKRNPNEAVNLASAIFILSIAAVFVVVVGFVLVNK